MQFTWVSVRPGRSTPADPVYWMFNQTGRRSQPGFESVVTISAGLTMAQVAHLRLGL